VIQPLRLGTPLEDHLAECGLLVKREDLSCPPPGPPFSKTRGVFAHVKARYDQGVRIFGALDTFHSQAGHAVAHACRILGAECVNYFPVYKAELQDEKPERVAYRHTDGRWMSVRPPQQRSFELGAEVVGIPAGRSAVLYHTTKRDCLARGGYMMPNALKLPEMVEETAAEVIRTFEGASRDQFEVLRSSPWLISCSSATIASGVIKGVAEVLRGGFWANRERFLLHMGYDRSPQAMAAYINANLGWMDSPLPAVIIQEGYAYADQARPGPTPPWPCNPYYDLKALRWWLREGREVYGRAVLWNIG
jgi:hypothetical protein